MKKTLNFEFCKIFIKKLSISRPIFSILVKDELLVKVILFLSL